VRSVCGVKSFPQETIPKLDNKSIWHYNNGIVIDKENELGDFFTGATVSKKDNFYSVEYKGQIVAKFAIKDLAVVTAMDRVKLETLLQKSNVFVLKAA
jgi:hypothetical protein